MCPNVCVTHLRIHRVKLPLVLVFLLQLNPRNSLTRGMGCMDRFYNKNWTFFVSFSGGVFGGWILLDLFINHQSSPLRVLMKFSVIYLSSPVNIVCDLWWVKSVKYWSLICKHRQGHATHEILETCFVLSKSFYQLLSFLNLHYYTISSFSNGSNNLFLFAWCDNSPVSSLPGWTTLIDGDRM